MVDYATAFGAGFLLVTIAFTAWITWISLEGDRHGPDVSESPEDSEAASE